MTVLFQIGLMRNGKLLDEGCPSLLMAKYSCNTVEEVFLLLSAEQETKVQKLPVVNTLSNRVRCDSGDVHRDTFRASCLGRSKALLAKNVLRVVRHPG